MSCFFSSSFLSSRPGLSFLLNLLSSILWYSPSRLAWEWMLTRLILVNISPICQSISRTTCQSISLCFVLSWNTGLTAMWKCSLPISNPTPQRQYISRLMRSQFNSNQITSNSSSFNHFKKKKKNCIRSLWTTWTPEELTLVASPTNLKLSTKYYNSFWVVILLKPMYKFVLLNRQICKFCSFSLYYQNYAHYKHIEIDISNPQLPSSTHK